MDRVPHRTGADVIGERWSLLTCWDLRRTGRCASRFRARLAGLAPNTLSARLKTLEAQGVVGTRLYQSHPPRYEYFLTDKGQAETRAEGTLLRGATSTDDGSDCSRRDCLRSMRPC